MLLPVGSVEPHGPHLSLLTDTVISETAAERASRKLEERGFPVYLAPAIPYGVTHCAAAFPGAISVAADALTAYVAEVVGAFLGAGAHHVCVVNNHLEPEHDRAIRDSVEHYGADRASVACPLTRRWARTLSPEFKSGACHAGRYETSLMLAARPDLVQVDRMRALEEVPISLSDMLRAGVSDFAEMGLLNAYAGDPAAATAREGDDLLDLLADMIVGEVLGGLETA